MFKLFATLLTFVALLASLQTALAIPAFTAPVASTTANGGGKMTLRWSDNNKSPAYNSKAWGNSTIYLAAGSQNTQFKLQTLASNVPPSKNGGKYTIDKTIGPSGKYYFIRMEGSQKDASGNAVMAFSARFTLNGMSGQFNSTVLSAAMGQEGAAPSSASNSGVSTSRSTSALTSATSPASASTNRTSDAGRLIANSNGLTALFATGALAAVGLVAAF